MDLQKPTTLGRALALWLGSYLIVAVCLFLYSSASLFSLILGGLATFVVTFLRYK